MLLILPLVDFLEVVCPSSKFHQLAAEACICSVALGIDVKGEGAHCTHCNFMLSGCSWSPLHEAQMADLDCTWTG